MRGMDVGPIPIVDNDETRRVVGIVTDRDLAIQVVADRRNPDVPLEQVMTRQPLVCRNTDDLEIALEIMSDHQVRRVPIVDSHGRLVGIISQADLARRVSSPRTTAEILEEISRPSETASV